MGYNPTGDDYINTAQKQIMSEWGDLSREAEAPSGIHITTRGKTLSEGTSKKTNSNWIFHQSISTMWGLHWDKDPPEQIMCEDYL